MGNSDKRNLPYHPLSEKPIDEVELETGDLKRAGVELGLKEIKGWVMDSQYFTFTFWAKHACVYYAFRWEGATPDLVTLLRNVTHIHMRHSVVFL